jgi:apolipoprotein N-acyltransferase
MKRNTLKIYGAVVVLITVVELVLCFAGPIAFARKPAVMLFPLFGSGMEPAQSSAVSSWIERELALTGSYQIGSRRLLEDRGHPLDAPIAFDKAQVLGRELGMERFALAVVFAGAERGVDFSIVVRSTLDGEAIRSARGTAESVEALVSGKAAFSGDGGAAGPAALREALRVETRGVGPTDVLVLALLAAHAAIGLLALAGRDPRRLVEVALAPALILFLFAWIYARGANMDYMQRFAATSGQITLAQSTALEQAFALLRFGPLLAADAAFIAARALARSAAARGPGGRGWLAVVVEPWAVGWVIVAAAAWGLAFPSFASLDGWGALAWVALVPLFLVLITSPTGMGIYYGVLFGGLQALIINFWHGTYSYVTLHLVTIGFVVEYLLFMGPLKKLIDAAGRWGFVAVAAAWTLFDWLRSVGLLAYPWGLAGASQHRFVSLIQVAAVTGVWGIGFLVVLVNAAIAWALAAPAGGGPQRRAAPPRAVDRLGPPALAALAVAACAVAGGTAIARDDAAAAGGRARATIVLVQPNTDPRKHSYDENQQRLRALTDDALASMRARPDLVVWPEGAFPFDIREWSQPGVQDQGWGPTVTGFGDYVRSRGVWLLTGTRDHDSGGEGERHYNSSTLLDPGGSTHGFYHKMRLVPFTEHFPLDKKKFAGLYEMFLKFDISNWTPGSERLVYDQGRMRLVTMICFEDVFGDHVRRFVRQGVDVILNIGNDYWSMSPVEGRQHGIFALFRAVENHRPVLRSTCSGYTVAIDAAGRIRDGAPAAYTAGWTAVPVRVASDRMTAYTRWGDWFPAACGLALAAALARAAARAGGRATRAVLAWRRRRGGAMMEPADAVGE